MAYQNHNHKHHNRNHYGWWNPSNEYEYETTVEPAYPRHHHHKGHVALGSNYEEPIVEAYPKVREPETETIVDRFQRARHGDHNAFASVDDEADAFIQYEHKRMELAKLKSMGAF